jgi:hypothetical protein
VKAAIASLKGVTPCGLTLGKNKLEISFFGDPNLGGRIVKHVARGMSDSNVYFFNLDYRIHLNYRIPFGYRQLFDQVLEFLDRGRDEEEKLSGPGRR